MLCLLAAVAASAPSPTPHPHNGLLKKYEFKSPRRYGCSLRGISDEELRKGKPVVRRLPGKLGSRGRLMSVQDVHAPEKVVWNTINDVTRYPEMCDGVISTDVYAQRPTKTGGKLVKAQYKIRLAPAVSVGYYVTHVFEPLKHCMTFHLDYDRCSELDDTVGYW